MLWYVAIITYGKIVLEAIGLLKKTIETVQDKMTPKIESEEIDKEFFPGDGVIEKMLGGKFPYVTGQYRVKIEGNEKILETRHIGNKWQFRYSGDVQWWLLPKETIEKFDWIEILSY